MVGWRRAGVLPGGGVARRKGASERLVKALPFVGGALMLFLLYTAVRVLYAGEGRPSTAAELQAGQPREAESPTCPKGFMHITYDATFDDFRSPTPAWDWKAVREAKGPFTAEAADELLLEVDLLGHPLVMRPRVGERGAPGQLKELLDAFGCTAGWDDWEDRAVYSFSDLNGEFFSPPESLLQHKGIEEVLVELTWPNSQPQTRIIPWRAPNGSPLEQIPLHDVIAYLSQPSGKRSIVTTDARLEDAQYCFSTDQLFLYPSVPLVSVRPSAVSGSAFHAALVDAAQPYFEWLVSSNSAPIWTRMWRSSLQIGPAGSVTRMHWDEPALGTQAIFTISGLKRVVLIPPYDMDRQFAGVDLFQPLTPQFNVQPSHPLRHRAPHFVDVSAGEVLLVPAGWLHAVFNVVDSVGASAFEY